MKGKLILRGSLFALLLSGCQSSPLIEESNRAAQVEEAGTKPASSYQIVEPKAAIPNEQVVPKEPGPRLIVQEIRAQAETHLREGRWNSSIELAERGLRIDRREPAFYLILSESYWALGDLVQAQRFADQASRLCARDCGAAKRMQKRLAGGH